MSQAKFFMLTEARPLGLDGTTLVVGHNTGALADRINAPQNNRDIVDVFTSKLGANIAVRCVVGTDPAAANVQPAARKPVWNPRSTPEPGHAGAGGESGADGSDSADSADPADPADADRAKPPADDWRAAASAASQRAAAKAAQAAQAAQSAQVAHAAQVNREADEIPPPPEPVDDEPPYDAWDDQREPVAVGADPGAGADPEPAAQPEPPQDAPAPYTREDEERDMATQAENEEGSFDRRDATEVAMELLAKELDAKPL